MNNIGGTSRFIAFFDECGDHSLMKIDRDFPLFLLAAIVVERSVYIDQILRAMGALKMQYWNHEGVNLHSREIRKALGPFSFMHVPSTRFRFLDQLTNLITDLPFTLFIAGIQLADLWAHPCARHVLKPDQSNRAYDIAQKHIYKEGGVCGWKIFS